jgi:hypothetical protein
MRRVLVAGCLLLTVLLPATAALAADAAGGGGAGDFNGDGVADLAVGVPGEDVDGIPDAGAVNVLYGSATGITAAGDQLFTQATPGVPGAAEAGDRFGSAVATGDFNRDGYSDLAVGVPLEDLGAVQDAGAVAVLYGSAAGLTASGSRLFSQATPGVPDAAAAGEAFGLALAAGNFGNSTQADLAIGVPGVTQPDRSTIVGAGAVTVLYGSAAGLTASGARLFSQATPGVQGIAEYADTFGLALVAANFGNGDQADLAVGVPGEDLGGRQDAGAVNIIYGSTAGLTTAGNQLLHQDSPGIANPAEAGDAFGAALTAANFGSSGQADLAIGVPGEDVSGVVDAGAVNIIYGATAGLTATGNQLFSQATPGIPDAPEMFDDFGGTLAAANFGNSSHADLAVGVPFEDAPDLDNVGAVNVIYGSAGGLTTSGSQFFLHRPEAFAGAWLTLTAANFGRSGHADLAVGIPDQEVGILLRAGAVTVLYGSPTGLTRANEQFFTQDSPGVEDVTEEDDLYGCATPFCALGFPQPD